MPNSDSVPWFLVPTLLRVGAVCAKSGMGRRRRGEISGDRSRVRRTNGELFSGEGLRSAFLRLGGKTMTLCLRVGSRASFALGTSRRLANASGASRYLPDQGSQGKSSTSSLALTNVSLVGTAAISPAKALPALSTLSSKQSSCDGPSSDPGLCRSDIAMHASRVSANGR